MNRITRKILCALPTIALLVLFALPGFAAPQTMLIDEAGLLSRTEAAALDQRLLALSEQYQCDTVIVTVDSADEATLKELTDERYTGSDYGRGRDCLMLLIDAENKAWRLATWGDAVAFTNAGLRFINDRLKEDLFEGDDNAALNNYADWCARFHEQAQTGRPYGEGNLPQAGGAAPITHANVLRAPGSISLLMDEAGLLSTAEAVSLRARLETLSAKWKNDIVIVMVDSIGTATPMAFADDWFDYNGYGRDENEDITKGDGLLLLINMEERDWWISTKGYSIHAFTDAGIEFLGEQLISDGLSDGDYAKAFNGFADWCDKFFAKAEAGKPYDTGSLPKTAKDVAVRILLSFGGGLIVAWLVTNRMKGKLKTVKKQQAAADYVRPGSLQVAYANEQFLYKNVTRVYNPPSSDSGGGGGSSTHSSSSGSSHGGGGGKF